MTLIKKNLEKLILNQIADKKKSNIFPSIEELNEKLEYFQEKFGYRALKLNGKELLLKMHKHHTKDEAQSLKYWLENKSDEEFPNYFGSITVGNSGQYRVYYSPPEKDDCWKNKNFEKISEADAIKLAEENRDMLIMASKKCGEILHDKSQESYKRFDAFMKENLPELYGKQWVHKYLFLMNPDKLSDIHSNKYLLHMLLKLGIIPNNPRAYYELDYYFVKLAEDINKPISHLTTSLFEIYGKKSYRYWQLQLTNIDQVIDVASKERYLEYMIENSVLCFGKKEFGDLDNYYSEGRMNPFKEKMKHKIEELGWEISLSKIDSIVQNYAFFYNVCGRKGLKDIILVLDGNELKLMGQLEDMNEISYVLDEDFPYHRGIKWIKISDDISLDVPDSKYCFSLLRPGSSPEIIQEIEYIRLLPSLEVDKALISFKKDLKITQEEITISNTLKRKNQVILYGPPGTGKTYWAIRAAKEFIANNNFKKRYLELNSEERKDLLNYIEKCCFHPSYSYEDFIIGYRPQTTGKELMFELKDGIFKTICEKALGVSKKYFVIIIDEINRGDIPRIFGELMMIIEKDKRGEKIDIPYSPDKFQIPPLLYIIGTMNTADRSIALLDTALRRRFAFIEFMPNYLLLDSFIESEDIKLSLKEWLRSINKKIRTFLGKDGRNLQIGHAYLLKKEGVPIHEIDNFVVAFRQDIIPLLEEYCYGDYGKLSQILGEKIVAIEEQRINDSLFSSENWNELFKAIKEQFPEACEEIIDTSSDAIEEDEESEI